MSQSRTLFIGMDVPKDSIAVAYIAHTFGLAPGAQALGLIAAPTAGEGIVKNHQNTLTVSLRACVRRGTLPATPQPLTNLTAWGGKVPVN